MVENIKCKHEKIIINKTDELDSYIDNNWKFQSTKAECGDCGTKIILIRYRKLFWWGKWQKLNTKNCKHRMYTVKSYDVEKEEEYKSKKSLKTSFSNIIFGENDEKDQDDENVNSKGKILLGIAECCKCKKNFYVKASFNYVWSNKQIVINRTSKWKKVVEN